jgi:hypothetical protein
MPLAVRKMHMSVAAEERVSNLHCMLTTNNVPLRQAATELRALLPSAYAKSVRHGVSSTRGVNAHIPVDVVHSLTKLKLPERVYAVICTVPADDLPNMEALLPRLEALAAGADGWHVALAAHSALHPTVAELTFAVRAKRKGARFKAAANDFELGARLGAALHRRFGWRVDLSRPMLEVTASLNDDGLLISLALLRRDDAVDCKTRGGLDPHVSWAMVRT